MVAKRRGEAMLALGRWGLEELEAESEKKSGKVGKSKIFLCQLASHNFF